MRLFSFISALSLSIAMILSNVSAGQVSVFLNGKELVSDQEPVIIEGSAYIPMRSIFEAFGFEVDWNSDKKRIKAKKVDDNYIIIFQTGSKIANVCGKNKNLEKAPVIFNNRVLLPLRAVGEELGAEVVWSSSDKKVFITKSNSSVVTQVSRNFIYQNYADKDFWSDNTWEEKKEDYFNTEDYLREIFSGDIEDFEDSDDDTDRDYDRRNNKYNIGDSVSDSTPSVLTVEKQVLELVNEEREKQNIAPLKWNDDLANLARAHSEDMVERNFFGHINPDGQDAFERMKIYGIDYSYAAENIASGQMTAKAAVNSWMTSEGHRENILNPNLTELGVGTARGGEHGFYWTQCFRGK